MTIYIQIQIEEFKTIKKYFKKVQKLKLNYETSCILYSCTVRAAPHLCKNLESMVNKHQSGPL